ncbi:hypothetical protein NIES2109_47690 [Nostoc sp. HK-01]|uniref:RNase H domain protein, YqgF family n=1 Tax=Nostoc cycadae WK-1 TaxID=1861711 RepID=A0A2H6LK00_9NOSO|nr:hypothetical protein [Nostoc cycadae]BBD61933.1 hypothetical protein NIES2109_47690 [Nostoc sp. HK-01]GBE93545.1 RNase H domain protein, YqgF family [Nostoc cycadae WK-1]
MLSGKWKFLRILLLSIIVTAAISVYITQPQNPVTVFHTENPVKPQFSVMQHTENLVVDPERINYKSIPLESLNAARQGSDPETLALNAIEDVGSEKGIDKIEVIYPQHNQALVTITHIPQNSNSVNAIKYRVEMNTFGRSLLVSSPPVWEIIWAGSQVQCKPGSRHSKQLNQSKNLKCEG